MLLLGEKNDGREVGKYGLGQRNTRRNRLVEFSRGNNIVIATTLFEKHK